MSMKQELVAKKLLKNPSIPISKAMVEAGYTPATAKSPQKLTMSKGWAKLMEEYFPDEDLVKVHKEGLHATRIFSSHTEPDKEVPDHPTRHKFLETAYKLKRYIGDKNDGQQDQPNILVIVNTTR